MRIGFVYDLRDHYRALGFSEEAVAEFDTPETIDEIAAALARAGGDVERIGNGRTLAGRLVAGERFELVFSIAEGLAGRNREAQVPALCELFDQPYVFSDPLTLSVALDKAIAKRLVREAGIPTSPFALLARAEAARDVVLDYPLFVKPNAEGTGKGCEAASKVFDAEALEATARRLIARFDQPVIVEPYLPGREFTVGIIGTGDAARVIGVAEILLHRDADSGVYSLTNKEECESRVTYELATDETAEEAGVRALEAYRTLGCRDGGRIDLRCDAEGSPLFMEANPLAGLHSSHSDLPIIAGLTGYGYDRLMRDILSSARSRYSVAGKPRRTASA
jgi:D-alanine-D-alanine ligase